MLLNSAIRQVNKMPHVYVVTNLTNNKIYIGKTVGTPEIRLRKHFQNSVNGLAYLHRAIKKYGRQSFTIRSLAEVGTEEQALRLEKFFIKCLESNSPEFGYNLTEGGDGISGYRHREESKRQCRLNNIGKHKVSDDVRKRLSESRKRFTGENHPRFGVRLSDSTKQKMRKAKLGKPWSEARRKAQNARLCESNEIVT